MSGDDADPLRVRRSPARAQTAGSSRRRVSPRLTVTVSDGRGRPVRAPGLAGWLVAAAPRGSRGDVGVALVSDRRMRALNRDFRGADSTTDVLSFPAGERVMSRRAGESPPPLGDIVIATGRAARQARRAGHPLSTELRVLALHGLLHLLGYDHEGARDAGLMARLEQRLRRRAGLREGLIERERAQ
jgi:probable rRNA maturation factor